MQRSLLLWRTYAFYLIMLYCLLSSTAQGQIRYSFAASSGTYSYLSGSGRTTIVNGDQNNSLSGLTNIGFNFTYGCNTYTQFKASSNGWISLGDNTTQNMSGNQLSITGNGPIIAPLWDDLKTGSTGVVMKLTGNSPNRILTIEWREAYWDAGADDPVLSFQIKLYETSNLIEFIYQREDIAAENGSASIGISGGSLGTDFYSVNGVTTSATASYGSETNNLNSRPTSGLTFRWTPLNMGYVSSTATQTNTANISKCNNLQQQLIGVQVVVQGCNNPLSVTEFKINMLGTTATADVSAIHIYYTGTVAAFSPIQNFGPVNITPATGVISVTGTQQLSHGTHYFWISYDISASATVNNVVDAQCTQVTVGGSAQTVSSSNPSGTRTIVACPTAPGGINGHSFWVKADVGTSTTTNGALLSQWSDQSGSSRHATNGTAANQPTFYDNATKNLNFNPVVEFDEAAQSTANADFMDINNNGILSNGNTPYDVYAVIVPGSYNLTTPGKFLFAGEAGLNNFNAFDVRSNYSVNDSWNMNDLIIPNTWAVDSLLMLTFDYNILRRESYKAGTSIGTRTSAPRVALSYNNALGYQRTANLEYYDGGIAEIITYANVSHDPTARYKVESYLGIKYGITLPHNYIASNGTTVWNRSTNASYNNNIIGIARDNTGALLQRQSRSTNANPDILTIYVGTKQVNQKNNSGNFTAGDLSFFMVGHNNGYPLNQWPGTNEKPAGICCRIFREWLVQKTNFTNTDLKLEFNFNNVTPGTIPLNSADLRLLVDADGDFTNATIYGSSSVTITTSAGVATVTVPASLLANGSYFTLGSVSANTVLPLELKAFSGVCRNEEVQLKWATATPSAYDFVVERSTDKVNFSPVGTVVASSADNYSWTDLSPLPGTLYYRLKITKASGEPLYSAITTVSGCNTTAIQLSTDPGSGESTLMLQLQQKDRSIISVYDIAGRRVEIPGLTGQRSLDKGVHYMPVRIPGATAGMYFLHVTINEEPHVFRIIKK
ncbi:MAG: hypothetical protein J7621_28880 [Niastella sp.]|nr:hypothetical protein [Niastella sp.]